MIGAILGDIVGSRFEFNNIKTKNFELFDKNCYFTDDSVMTQPRIKKSVITHLVYSFLRILSHIDQVILQIFFFHICVILVSDLFLIYFDDTKVVDSDESSKKLSNFLQIFLNIFDFPLFHTCPQS